MIRYLLYLPIWLSPSLACQQPHPLLGWGFLGGFNKLLLLPA